MYVLEKKENPRRRTSVELLMFSNEKGLWRSLMWMDHVGTDAAFLSLEGAGLGKWLAAGVPQSVCFCK